MLNQPREFAEKPELRRHQGVGCDNNGIIVNCKEVVDGVRYKCAHCMDFDYCEVCEEYWEKEHKETLERSE